MIPVDAENPVFDKRSFCKAEEEEDQVAAPCDRKKNQQPAPALIERKIAVVPNAVAGEYPNGNANLQKNTAGAVLKAKRKPRIFRRDKRRNAGVEDIFNQQGKKSQLKSSAPFLKLTLVKFALKTMVLLRKPQEKQKDTENQKDSKHAAQSVSQLIFVHDTSPFLSFMPIVSITPFHGKTRFHN